MIVLLQLLIPFFSLVGLATIGLMLGGAANGAPSEKKELAAAPETPRPTLAETPPVVTRHQLKIGDRTLDYIATCGMMSLKNEQGEIAANLFFTAYTLDATAGPAERPLMFSFNGGPGSSSVWLHLGGLGPQRVAMLDDGAMPAPPFRLVDNDFTWLEATDLVFIDPVETGYSRAATPELGKRFHGVQSDRDAIGEFIRLYLTRYQRWSSPLFLVGESYGTFRAAGLAGDLIEKGIAFNGIILVSSVLQLQTLLFDSGNDLPYLPSYAATAWYHGRLAKDLQKKLLADLLAEVEAWTVTDYTIALAKGATLTEQERTATIERLARYTGLEPRYIELSNLRLQISRFCKELLRDGGRTVGRLDSRYTGTDQLGISEYPDFDPSLSAIRPPYTAMINDYLRGRLGYETDAEYHILRSLEWDWGSAGEGYPRTDEALSQAFAKNPYLWLFVASGYYDLVTPYFATEYTLNHLSLAGETRSQIQTEEYPVGHMVYLERATLAKLRDDVARFIANATSLTGKPLKG